MPSSSFPYNHNHSHGYDSPTSTPSRPAYVAYKPSSCDTPPASPPLRAPYTHGLSAKRGLLPVQLNMDTAVGPAYERRAYSPAPESPTLQSALPSPNFPPPRQRAPSLLRHAAASTPKYAQFPQIDGPT